MVNSLELEYAYRTTKENLEELHLKKQYLLIDKDALSSAIAVNKKFNDTAK